MTHRGGRYPDYVIKAAEITNCRGKHWSIMLEVFSEYRGMSTNDVEIISRAKKWLIKYRQEK